MLLLGSPHWGGWVSRASITREPGKSWVTFFLNIASYGVTSAEVTSPPRRKRLHRSHLSVGRVSKSHSKHSTGMWGTLRSHLEIGLPYWLTRRWELTYFCKTKNEMRPFIHDNVHKDFFVIFTVYSSSISWQYISTLTYHLKVEAIYFNLNLGNVFLEIYFNLNLGNIFQL